MKKINYVHFSSIPSNLPSSLQVIKTCENFSKNNYEVTLIKPGTGNKKISIKKYYGLKYDIRIKEFKSIKSFPQGLKFYLYCIYCLFFILTSKKSVNISRSYFITFLLLLFKQKVVKLPHLIEFINDPIFIFCILYLIKSDLKNN